MTEEEAHAAVLRWCRRSKAPGPVMRFGVQGQPECRVIDVSRTEPVEGSTWERRAVVYAEGETWLDCAKTLGLEA